MRRLPSGGVRVAPNGKTMLAALAASYRRQSHDRPAGRSTVYAEQPGPRYAGHLQRPPTYSGRCPARSHAGAALNRLDADHCGASRAGGGAVGLHCRYALEIFTFVKVSVPRHSAFVAAFGRRTRSRVRHARAVRLGAGDATPVPSCVLRKRGAARQWTSGWDTHPAPAESPVGRRPWQVS